METVKRLLLPLLLLALATPTLAFFDQANYTERITNYDSVITIDPSGTMDVVETIRVIALNQQINHGIYRDFPTKYKDQYGTSYNIPFKILRIEQDGASQDYHTQNLTNGIRIYIGKSNEYVTTGPHTYVIEYQVNREIGFFKDHDELYWNVTGNGWIFPIDEASAKVFLPKEIPLDKVTSTAYTGAYGATGSSYTIASSGLSLETTQPLQPYEGFTIALSFPKGYIHEPTAIENFWYWAIDNIAAIILFLFVIALSLFYFRAWWKYGRDPKSEVIIAEYEPPQGFTPADVRYLSKERYDRKALVAMFIELAHKGFIHIDQSEKSYTLEKKKEPAPGLSAEEVAAMRLFRDDDKIAFTKAYDKSAAAAYRRSEQGLKEALKKKIGSNFFKLNRTYVGVVVPVSIIFVLLIFPFIGPNFASGISIALIIALHIIFTLLLPARTQLGRKVLDEIEGFKWFLGVTEKDRMNFANPPEQTPALFEKYLSYAFALDVEQQWAEQFATVFRDQPDYHPVWYTGYPGRFSPVVLASSVGGGMSSVIASSTVAPGSSSGMGGGFGGGGGVSGGGGGGGGGGGW